MLPSYRNQSIDLLVSTRGQPWHLVGEYNRLILLRRRTDTEFQKIFNFPKTESMLFGTAKGLSLHGKHLNIQYKNVLTFENLGNIRYRSLTLNCKFDRDYKGATK